MGRRAGTGEVFSRRALNRATLDRQFLLRRSTMSVTCVLEALVGMQAQTPHTAYTGLWSRLDGFEPGQLSDRIADRSVVRMALMRSTIHMVTARDAWAIRPIVQPVLDRMQKGQFGRRLQGVDTEAVVAMGRAFVESEPRTFRALGDHLLTRWPDRDRFALEQVVRAGVQLVQVPPRGLWGRSGPIAHTTLEAWLGDPPAGAMTLDTHVRRYLAAFGPASVMDAQAWCGLTRLGEVFERLRPQLAVFADERGRELFDLPDSPRPDPATPAPPRFLYDFDNLLLSHADRTRVIDLSVAQARLLEPHTRESLSTFLVDGFVAGIWTIVRERRKATLVITPVTPLAATDLSALTEEGARLLAFAAADATERDIRIWSR